MSRSLTPAVATAIAAPNVIYTSFVFMDFANGPLRANLSGQTINWAGYDWLGVGTVATVGDAQEGSDAQAYGLQLTLTGIPPDYIVTALNTEFSQRKCTIWLAILDTDYAVVSDPIIVFQGRMDQMDISLSNMGVITITTESRLADLYRPRSQRFNHQDQISKYPTDQGFQYVDQMVDKEIAWGR